MIPDPSVNIWAHTKKSLYELYEKRAYGMSGELDCHAQAADIYAEFHQSGNLVLDAGGGSGYFYWSLKRRGFDFYYHLSDYTFDFIQLGRRALAGQSPEPVFLHESIEQTPLPNILKTSSKAPHKFLDSDIPQYNAVFCINTLFCLADYRQGLERLLLCTKDIIIIRTPLADRGHIRFETDDYLDPEAEELKSYFNIWPLEEINSFIQDYGFKVSNPVDRRTADRGEMSAGKFFPWRWVVGTR